MRANGLSMVCTTYNSREYVPSLIASLLLLNPPPDEYVFVDDASTDGTPDQLRSLIPALEGHGKPITCRFLDSNLGSSGSRNIGLTATGARYVAFLDGDDLPLPWRVGDTLSAFATRPTAGVVYGPIVGVVDRSVVFVRGGRRYKSGPVGTELSLRNFIPFSTVCIDREQVGSLLFDDNVHQSEDYKFLSALASRTEFNATRRPLVLYRFHSGAKSANLEASIVAYRKQMPHASHSTPLDDWVPLPLAMQRLKTSPSLKAAAQFVAQCSKAPREAWTFRNEVIDYPVSRLRSRSMYRDIYDRIETTALSLTSRWGSPAG